MLKSIFKLAWLLVQCVFVIYFFSLKFVFLLNYISFTDLFTICSICCKVFSSEVTLAKHCVWHHKSIMPSFRFNCNLCPYSTNESSHFKTHSVVHDPNRELTCDSCNNRFTSVNSLSRHKLIHTGLVQNMYVNMS